LIEGHTKPNLPQVPTLTASIHQRRGMPNKCSWSCSQGVPLWSLLVLNNEVGLMDVSKPFKRKGGLHRWRFYDGVKGERKKALQYFHRKARKWFDAKDPKGVRIVSTRRGRQ
jgi:hypothetical protein